MHRKLMILGLIVLAISCGNDTNISADDYDTSCASDEDCEVILVGNMCECVCEYGAINMSAISRYKEDRDALDCGGACESKKVDCYPCTDETRAFCQDSICRSEVVNQ